MPVTPTYDLIASNVLSSSASSVTFSSIPGTYRDLVLVIQASGAGSMRFNGDSGLNYSYVNMRGNGTAASSISSSDDQISLQYFRPGIYQIMDYAQTDKHKSVLIRESSASAGWVYATTSRWANTSAITTINLVNLSAVSGDSFYLYGIAS